MVISRTPFRISFFGGGTDYKNFFEQYGGSVISTTFNKYCYITVRDLAPFFEYKNQLTYSKIERFNNPDEVSHPVVREFLKYKNENGLQISYDADLPARSGLGSSSAFAVGLVNAVGALRGKRYGAEFLAREAIFIERELCGECGGLQDQIAVAFGGFNRIDFDSTGFQVKPVNVLDSRLNELNKNLMLFFSGIRRYSYDITIEQNNNVNQNIDILCEMKQIVDDAEALLMSGKSIDNFGMMLDDSWNLKKKLSNKIANPIIDEMYDFAKEHGAIGGKLLGAGGGGFLLLYVPEKSQDSVRNAMKDYIYFPFEFESTGSRIIY